MALKLAIAVVTLTLAGRAIVSSAPALISAADFGGPYVQGGVKITVAPDLVDFNAVNMAPGDATTRAVTVTNAGALALRYAVSLTTTGSAVLDQLWLTVWAGDGPSGCESNPPAIVLHGPAPLASEQVTHLLGDPAQGSQAGDRVLAAGATETLCVQVSAPLTMNAPAQEGITTGLALHFEAEQTKNNP